MILILEGIHALNPELTPHIPTENKYKIYVSALTTILLDNHNYIPTTDNRLLRRYYPRPQIPWLFRRRNDQKMAQRTCRRRKMDLSISRKCRCHVQFCPIV